jgi:hypothetical protein
MSTSGYTACACRDCFDCTVSSDVTKPELCSDCFEAGCSYWHENKPARMNYLNTYECKRSDAYGQEG